MTDRSRYEKEDVLLVPREIEQSPYHPYGNRKWGTGGLVPKKHTPEEEEARQKAILQNKRERLQSTCGNFQMANRKLEQLLHELDCDMEQELKRPARERAERIKHLERIQKIWQDPEAWAKERDCFYDPTTVPPSISDPKPPNSRPVRKPDDYPALMKELERLKAWVESEPMEF